MPQDIGTLLVRISADISDLKSGVAQAKSEINALKEAANSQGGQMDSLANSAAGFVSGLQQGVKTMFNMVGATMSVYGAFVLLRGVTQHWYDLMKSGVDAIDDYKRNIYASAGMMASITELGPGTPNLQVAYNQWKEYFDWLFRMSLETSRKVASSGKEIFQAGMELVMRGLVPKTEDQVYVTAQLVDFIKSVTRGLSEQQQLFQEIRSLFEGQMRLGAQTLQKFTQIDPDFKSKFEAARTAAMSMKDATPIWELLAKTMEGARYAAVDMATTFTSMYNTGKTATQLLLMEAFGPMYDQVVKLGWSLIDLVMQHGKLTQSGEQLAAGLSKAWAVVQGVIQEYVTYIVNNGPEVAAKIEAGATALGHVANAAITAAGAIVKLVNAMAMINWNDLYIIIAAAGAGAAIGGLPGAAVAGATAALWRVTARTNEANQKTLETQAAYVGRSDLAKTITESTPAAGGFGYSDEKLAELATTKTKAQVELSNAVNDKIAQRATDFANQVGPITREIDAVKKSPGKGDLGPGGKVEQLQQKITDLRKSVDNEIDQIAFDKGLALTKSGVSKTAPQTGFAKISEAADKKKTGGAGRTERDLQLEIELNKAMRQDAITQAEEEYKSLKATHEKEKADLKLKYEEGKIDTANYYGELQKMANAEANKSQEILLRKKTDAKKAYDEIIQLNQAKVARGDITEAEGSLMNQIENWKLMTIYKKTNGEIDRQRIADEKEILNLQRQQIEAEKKTTKDLSKAKVDSAWGPLDKENAQVAEMRRKYEEMALHATEAQKKEFARLADLKELEIRYKTEIDGFVSAITTGINDMISGLINGTGDLKKTANKMFTDLLKSALEPGLKQLKQKLTDGFTSMFDSLGPAVASAAMAAIAIIGMLLTKTKTASSFTASSVTSSITGHENVRGLIAGDTTIPIAEISGTLTEAFVETNSILDQIELNTRNLGQLQLNLQIDIPGIKEAVATAMEQYFASYAQTLGAK